jgi:prepilin-type N-terminal cleavage/methylation domain-containing protein
MSNNSVNKGYSLVEVLLVLVLVGAIAGAGYLLYQRQGSETPQANTNTNQQESATADDVVEPPAEIKNADDLDAAEAALNANDPATSQSDEEKIEKELSAL